MAREEGAARGIPLIQLQHWPQQTKHALQIRAGPPLATIRRLGLRQRRGVGAGRDRGGGAHDVSVVEARAGSQAKAARTRPANGTHLRQAKACARATCPQSTADPRAYTRGEAMPIRC